MIINPSGIFVSRELRIELLLEGKGLGFVLTPDQARSLAQTLLARADAVEQAQLAADEAAGLSRDEDFAKKAGIKL